jgi:hypothetical protein
MLRVAAELLKMAKEVIDKSRDYDDLLERIREAVDGHGYDEKVLGSLNDGDVVMFKPKEYGDRKRILIISGQHGEEPAGPWGLLKFLEDNGGMLDDVAVTVIPVANVHGFVTGERNGETGAHSNWFLNKDKTFRELGREAEVLRKNWKLLGQAGMDGLLNLHEDETSDGFYIYVLGDVKSKLVRSMLKAGLEHFEFKKNGHYEDNDGYELEDGIVDNHLDESWDEAMVRDFDIPISVTIETPGKSVDVKKRAACGAAMTKAFVKGVLDGK